MIMILSNIIKGLVPGKRLYRVVRRVSVLPEDHTDVDRNSSILSVCRLKIQLEMEPVQTTRRLT
jgi:hypothetical protein